MTNHIEKLVAATEQLMVSYRLAYGEGGSPDIGVRGYNMNHRVIGISYDGCRDDIVVIDGIPWLIAGDIWNTALNERAWNIHVMPEVDLGVLKVNVRAQAYVSGKTVVVDLGTRRVAERHDLESPEGVLVLA